MSKRFMPQKEHYLQSHDSIVMLRHRKKHDGAFTRFDTLTIHSVTI
jgi:hypothetical protein